MQETLVQSLGQEDPLEEGMVTHSSILVWRIPWTEEPGGLQFIWLQKVRHDWSNLEFTNARKTHRETWGKPCLKRWHSSVSQDRNRGASRQQKPPVQSPWGWKVSSQCRKEGREKEKVRGQGRGRFTSEGFPSHSENFEFYSKQWNGNPLKDFRHERDIIWWMYFSITPLNCGKRSGWGWGKYCWSPYKSWWIEPSET